MKLSKKMMVAAAAGALGVAAATPAMALETTFSGIYNLGFFAGNVDNGGGAAPFSPSSLANKNKMNNYFEQRARVLTNFKANDDLKLVTHFEIDSKFGGMGSKGYKGVSSANDSGQLDSDSVSIETKNIYLDFNLGKKVNVKTGIQTVSDKLKGLLFQWVDVAGIKTSSKLGALTLDAGYFRVGENNTLYSSTSSATGQNNYDIVTLEADYALSKNANIGAAYYLTSDYATASVSTIHTLGAFGAAKVGAVSLSGFAAMQTGYSVNSTATYLSGVRQQRSGYAGNVTAKMPIGPGTFTTSYLYTSGDDKRDARDTSWFSLHFTPSTGGPQANVLSHYSDAGMILLNRNLVNVPATSVRTLIFMGADNGTGNSILAAGYRADLTPKAYAMANVGVAFASKNQSSTLSGGKNGSNLMGTEVNLETGYKLYDNLTASVQAAYVMLGGYYNGTYTGALAAGQGAKNAENPYTMRVWLKYRF